MVRIAIKNIRRRKRITQNELADILGVSRQAVSMWEAGKREPNITMLNKIARVFGVMLDEIVKPERGMTLVKEVNRDMKQRAKRTMVEVKEVNTDMKINKKNIDFKLLAPEAKKVALTGDFNSWDEGGIPMRRAKNGLWRTGINLKPGRYEYKFIVDGQWWTDPENNSAADNTFGSKNSVKEVTL